ncbi:unnamed protein product [Caenorhabditis sp. 36 PRJEB53466]|nr:unnamed protein product [Caenorhabditis sp. 36 PRJEB53466]
MSDFSVNSSNTDIDPMPVECDAEYEETRELVKFGLQFVYLLLGIALNSALLWTIWKRYRETYLSNSFFVLFSMDCAVCETTPSFVALNLEPLVLQD